jgi:hypothetical protein
MNIMQKPSPINGGRKGEGEKKTIGEEGKMFKVIIITHLG